MVEYKEDMIEKQRIKPHSPWTGRSETFIDEGRLNAETRLAELKAQGNREQWAEEMKNYIMKYNVIDESVKKLSGYAPGVHLIDGKRILVRE